MLTGPLFKDNGNEPIPEDICLILRSISLWRKGCRSFAIILTINAWNLSRIKSIVTYSRFKSNYISNL